MEGCEADRSQGANDLIQTFLRYFAQELERYVQILPLHGFHAGQGREATEQGNKGLLNGGGEGDGNEEAHGGRRAKGLKNYDAVAYMRVLMEEMRFQTDAREEVVDITEDVLRILSSWGVRDGVVLVFAPHATAAVTLNENEPGLKEDILEALRRLVPRGAGYLHDRIDDNAHAHIRSALVKPYVVFPVKNGRPVLGTWQRILFIEADGPRAERRVVVQYLGL